MEPLHIVSVRAKHGYILLRCELEGQALGGSPKSAGKRSTDVSHLLEAFSTALCHAGLKQQENLVCEFVVYAHRPDSLELIAPLF